MYRGGDGALFDEMVLKGYQVERLSFRKPVMKTTDSLGEDHAEEGSDSCGHKYYRMNKTVDRCADEISIL